MPGYWFIDGTFDARVVGLQAEAIQYLQKTSERLIESEFGAVGLSVRDVLRGRQIELLRTLAGNSSVINRDRGDEVRHFLVKQTGNVRSAVVGVILHGRIEVPGHLGFQVWVAHYSRTTGVGCG